jgi:hypothetical protein
MLNGLDRAAATPADIGAARPSISKTLQIADSARRVAASVTAVSERQLSVLTLWLVHV